MRRAQDSREQLEQRRLARAVRADDAERLARRDVVANLLTLAFFVTPVLYPVEAVPERWRWLLWLNPFAPFFAGVQDSLFFFRPIPASDWLRMAAWAAVSVVLGGAIFERLRDSIAEEA